MSSVVRRYSRSAGFSLVEVLVALAIAAMMTAMLTRFVAGTRANAAKVAELTEMAALGETLLARIALPRNLKPGRTEGRRDVFTWRIDITPVSFTARPLRMKEKTAPAPNSNAAMASKPALLAGVNWTPYRIAVIIEAPSGQRHAVDTIRIGPGGTDGR